MTPAAKNGIQAISTSHMPRPHAPNSHALVTSVTTGPSRLNGVYTQRSMHVVRRALPVLLDDLVVVRGGVIEAACRGTRTRQIP